MNQSPIRVRFAPSPTGHLHIGGLRTALFNWFFARNKGGTYLIRIEDTDVARSKPEYVDSIMSSLTWSDLMPDEALVFQMSRLAEHKKAAERLLASGRAYRCFCRPSNTELVQEQLEAGIASQYPGTCRNIIPTEADLQKPHAIRFKLEKKDDKISFHDLIRNDLTFSYDQFDDFIIVRQDGIPTYNFVVVVDDIAMRISHVIRGEDHIYNTPKQIFLYQALEATPPLFAHLPLILSPNGGRLSKRDGSVSVVDYKEQGFLAPALCNYLVKLGWAYKDQEIFTKEEIIKLFTLENVSKSGAIFDHKKLEWVNSVYIKQMSAEQLFKVFSDVSKESAHELEKLWNQEQLFALIELYKERVVTTKELMQTLKTLAQNPIIDTTHHDQNHVSQKTKLVLTHFIEKLASENNWTQESITAAGKAVLTEQNEKMPTLGIPLRIAITGTTTSPGIFHLMAILPRDLVIQRINAFISLIQ